MLYDFTNHVVLITGGTRGIGYATAREFAKAGAKVAITSRSLESAQAAAAEIEAETSGEVLGIEAHVADADAATSACKQVAERFGAIDVLVNNAGTNPAFGPLIEQSHEALEKTFQVNTLAPIAWAREAVAHGLGKGSEPGRIASIINVSSIGALTVEPGLGAYNASKAALLHMTRQMACELGPAIRVNSVSPGIVRTKLSEVLWKNHEEAVAANTPMKRIGEPIDVANTILFLASDQASWITGENVVLDGGQLHGTAYYSQST